MEIPLSAVTMHPKGTPAPASSVKAQVFEERVDLGNDMTGRQMIAVGVRRLVLARGELDRLEGPRYAARRAELRRKAKESTSRVPYFRAGVRGANLNDRPEAF